jgi:coenzyme PQQ precursor peptide PqqA
MPMNLVISFIINDLEDSQGQGLSRIAFTLGVGYSKWIIQGSDFGPLGEIMEWTTPAFEEVCLNCEINSYASAKL